MMAIDDVVGVLEAFLVHAFDEQRAVGTVVAVNILVEIEHVVFCLNNHIVDHGVRAVNPCTGIAVAFLERRKINVNGGYFIVKHYLIFSRSCFLSRCIGRRNGHGSCFSRLYIGVLNFFGIFIGLVVSSRRKDRLINLITAEKKHCDKNNAKDCKENSYRFFHLKPSVKNFTLLYYAFHEKESIEM